MPTRSATDHVSRIDAIVDYWIGDAATDPAVASGKTRLWYRSSKALDDEIAETFGDDLHLAEDGKLEAWSETPEGSLALVILLDQFSRNVYRGTAKAFANDNQALGVTMNALEQGHDVLLPIVGTVFLLHPCHHAESLPAHEHCISGYELLRATAEPEWHELLDGFLYHAREHRDVIQRFGRFPHRNQVLGRESTQEEIDYLASGGRRYGQ